LTYTVGERSPGLLTSVVNARLEYLVPDSGGFSVRHKGDAADRGRECVWGRGPDGRPAPALITRQGPFAAALHYEGTADPADAQPLATRLDLTFPSSKSWVEMAWRVEDPQGIVAGLRFETRLKLEGGPTLVDLGAAATVYGVLRGREWMGLIAGSAPGMADLGRPWIVRKGAPETPSTFAEAPRPDAAPAEGWAHIMDATHCTALAVANFGRASQDRIEIDADGRVRVAREFAGNGASPTPGRKSLTCWLHFVSMPVQVGAATSPQAMLAPLEIAWGDPRP
jgi:hypothetical protein